jgi:ubiquinone/menaquinone biosynthesis C-methylase UbiE
MATSALNPDAFFLTGFAFIRTGVLKAAVDLELFTHIARGQQSADAIARAAYADERAVRILLDALTALGLLAKQDGLYVLPPITAQLLVKDSPLYAGAFMRIMANPRLWSAVGQLGEIVRTGQPPESMIDVPEHEFWAEFSEASERTSQVAAMLLADRLPLAADGPTQVLDVACGSGVYGFTVLERYPQARVTALDWQNVLEHARKVAQQRGLADRVTWLAGSAFEAPLPTAHFDAVIASHFYHHFPPAQNIELSARFFRTLKPGGRLVIHDWVADDTRSEREAALLFAVVMLASTARGDVYTFPEFRDMLEAAGFIDVTLEPVPLVGSFVMQARRPELSQGLTN